MKKIFCTIITLLMIISCIPIQLYADSTYLPVETGVIYKYAWQLSNNRDYYYFFRLNPNQTNNDVRAIVVKNGNMQRFYLLSLSPIYAQRETGYDETYATSWQNVNSTTLNSTYNCYIDEVNYLNSTTTIYGQDVPVVNKLTDHNEQYTAYYYTFGDGAVAPSPVINYGELIDLGYYTNFTNSQQMGVSSMRNNLDTITWNGYQDSNGNQINTIDFEVEIQAGITDYSGATKSDLLNQTLQNIDVRGYTTIYTGSANRGQAKFTWQEVATALWSTEVSSFDFWNRFITNYIDGFYYVYGWMYRIRLKKADDSWVGEWQTIYQVTSAPPADSQQIMNYYYTYYNTGVDPATYQAIQNINTINNVTNNYYYENQTIPSDDGDDISDGNWFQLIYQLLFGNDNETLVNQGNNVNQTVNNALDQEDDYLSDLQDQLNDLEPNDISENNGLINSLNWIRQVHNLTVETTLYRDIVITILFVGLIVYLIGRRQG